jgi:hypothetical protein
MVGQPGAQRRYHRSRVWHDRHSCINDWHADHVYRHDSTAIEALYLTVFLAFNVFHAFLFLNVRPVLRNGKTDSFWIRLIASEIYVQTPEFSRVRSP